MTAPVGLADSGVASVLARIAQIQQQFAPAAPPPAATASSTSGLSSAATSNSGTDFATALSSASASTASTAAPTADSGSGSGVTGAQVVASAEKYLGVPYVFGGTTPQGLDCSGLVQKAYGDLGVSLPRLSWDQAKVGTAVPSLAEAKPGDILGFGNPAEHVAIYLGNNMMIAAPQPGENVKIQSVYQTPDSIRRVVGADTASGGSAAESGVAAGSGATSGASAGSSTAALAQYGSAFAANTTRYHLPAGLLAAVAQTESGGNATAVSPAGAQGLMQLMPSTAAGLGVNPWDPSQAVQGAAQLLSGYLNKYGSVPLALAAYNAGPGAVDQYGGVPPYAETQKYVQKITDLMGAA
jgi:cell wall-associated NlpC family hydrolase